RMHSPCYEALARPFGAIDIAGMLAKLSDAADTVTFYEGARFHQQRFNEYGARLGAELVDLVQKGLQISAERYNETVRYVDSCKPRFTELFKATPVILTPAAVGPAPLGLASTGDPRMNAPWTALGTPAISTRFRLRVVCLSDCNSPRTMARMRDYFALLCGFRECSILPGSAATRLQHR